MYNHVFKTTLDYNPMYLKNLRESKSAGNQSTESFTVILCVCSWLDYKIAFHLSFYSLIESSTSPFSVS